MRAPQCAPRSVARAVPKSIELPYPADRARLFAPLANLAWAHWLDSSGGGRYDILTALPRVTLVTRGDWTRIEYANGRVEHSSEPPQEVLRRQLGVATKVAPAPFVGGVLGYFGYDLGRRLHRLPSLTRAAEGWPEMVVGLYDGALVLDHQERSCRLWHDDADWARRFLDRLAASPAAAEFKVTGPITSNLDVAAYCRAFERVQAYIRAGDCYQVNLALCHSAPCCGHPWPLYLALRERNPAPFAAWLNFPFGQVLSASPERFLSLRDGWVETRPIKGTRPRADDPLEDARRITELAASEKDRAENLMIVDLLRNDLGRVCAPGSITVPELFAVESYATVHHLVSVVRGRLSAERSALDLLTAAFPGGSITGAPKLRAMQIIEELEPEPRGVYCGAIGYLGSDGGMDCNIAIRTLTCRDGIAHFAAGGGLVADSEADAEYRECADKARATREVLERFLT
jgi:para-aminobenzoate synthetase component 1